MTPDDPLRDDDWVDALLLRDAVETRNDHLPEEGFTARVMDALPPRAALPAWRKPAVAALWAGAALALIGVLPGTVADMSYEVLRLLAGQRFSLSQVGVAVLALAAASWGGTLFTLRHDT